MSCSFAAIIVMYAKHDDNVIQECIGSAFKNFLIENYNTDLCFLLIEGMKTTSIRGITRISITLLVDKDLDYRFAVYDLGIAQIVHNMQIELKRSDNQQIRLLGESMVSKFISIDRMRILNA